MPEKIRCLAFNLLKFPKERTITPDFGPAMTCDAEDCGFQMLNDDEILTSVQEESDPVDDETDEDEENTTKVAGSIEF
ncbi:hypothetical protein TNCV_1685501 [Trichonephila clavipes]|nr:hypothetical protein TNCV_1685501 [Trichonephila clavipes]